jgi:hypothetical protein
MVSRTLAGMERYRGLLHAGDDPVAVQARYSSHRRRPEPVPMLRLHQPEQLGADRILQRFANLRLGRGKSPAKHPGEPIHAYVYSRLLIRPFSHEGRRVSCSHFSLPGAGN